MCLCRMRRWVTESLLRKCCDCTTKTFTTSGTYGILQSVLLALRTEDGMEQQEHIQKLADEYYEEGRARFFDHKLEEAAMLVQNALHLYKKCDDMLKYATALNMLGVIYGATGNETMAVDYLVEGLECAIDYQLNNITALFYNNIGSRYQELGEHENAIDYFLN